MYSLYFLLLFFFFFFFFAENRKVLIVGDSIIKDISHIDGVTLKAFPGATIGKLSILISNGSVDLHDFDYMIIHVGTNNIGKRDSFDNMISDYANLVAIIRRRKPDMRIIVSSILPRPVDHSITDSMIKKINFHLKSVMSQDLNFKFISSYKAVVKFGSFRRYLFAKLDKGLHLNTEGSNRLRYFFLRVISTVD